MDRADSYVNVVTELGTEFDKSTQTRIRSLPELTFEEIEAIYEQSGLGARIVDRVVDDATRAPFEITNADEPFDWKSVKSELDDLDALNELGDTWRWARLYGGAIAVLVVNDGLEFDKPLELERATRLKGINVIEGRYITPSGFNAKLGSTAFRLPSHYDLSIPLPGSVSVKRVHRSRCIRFDGAKVPPSRMLSRSTGWAPSVLRKIQQSLRQVVSSRGYGENILHEISVLILKLKGFHEALLGDENDEETLRKMFRAMRQGISIQNTLVLDADSDIGEQSRTVSGLVDLISLFVDALVSDSDMPRTILLGEQPGGLNATADAETRGWYDHVALQRQRILTPALTRVIDIILRLREQRGDRVPEEWTIEWGSLWQPSDKELAETRLINVQADTAQIDTMVTTAEEVRGRYIGSGDIVPDVVGELEVGT